MGKQIKKKVLLIWIGAIATIAFGLFLYTISQSELQVVVGHHWETPYETYSENCKAVHETYSRYSKTYLHGEVCDLYEQIELLRQRLDSMQ